MGQSPAAFLTPLNSSSAVDEITRQLDQAILSGRLPLGTTLNENFLSKSLGVSRGPLREALRQLEGRNLVERIPNVGARVVSLSRQDLRDIYELREVLEGSACRLASARMDDAELAELVEFSRREEERTRVAASTYSFDEDLDFHQRILRGARNKRLASLMNGSLFYLLRIFRIRAYTIPERPPQSMSEHRRIAEAMQGRNGARAEALMRNHIARAREAALIALQEE